MTRRRARHAKPTPRPTAIDAFTAALPTCLLAAWLTALALR